MSVRVMNNRAKSTLARPTGTIFFKYKCLIKLPGGRVVSGTRDHETGALAKPQLCERDPYCCLVHQIDSMFFQNIFNLLYLQLYSSSSYPKIFYLHFLCLYNRPILLKTGIFDQVRVDMGKEWVLILFIQELLSGFRENMDKPAHVKTTSKKNLTIERIWPEVNSRVNYPIKRVLVDLEEKGILDMTNENVQFCVSWFTCGVAKVGMKRFVDAWNNHRIKGKKTVPAVYWLNIYRPGVMLIFFKQRRTWAEPTLLIPLC